MRTVERSSVVDRAADEVFAWHSRPGALLRLLPPWQPVRVVEEAQSLADGSARLALPFGLSWVARHDPAFFDPPRQFSDYLDSSPLRELLRWRHFHIFEEAGEGRTLVRDRIETTVPAFLLTQMLAYRHRQLAEDLRVQQNLQAWQAGSLTIGMTGSSGTIGSALAAFLSTAGHKVVRLVRRPPKRPDERHWDPASPKSDLFADLDVVVHLAGASIAGRFSASHKQAIEDSRVATTRRLAQAIAKARQGSGRPHALVIASAIGYYGPDRGDELLDETSTPGDGFLARVVANWEAASEPASEAGARVIRIRTGVVLTPSGGLVRYIWPAFWLGLGARVGPPQAWLSWIGLDDLVDIYARAIVDQDLDGVMVATSPNPVTQTEFATTLARVFHRPAGLAIPETLLRLLAGREAYTEILAASQRLRPARLLAMGHRFRYPDLERALRHCLGRWDIE